MRQPARRSRSCARGEPRAAGHARAAQESASSAAAWSADEPGRAMTPRASSAHGNRREARSRGAAGSGASPRPVAVYPIVAADGLTPGGERERLAGFRVTAQHLQGATEAEERVVVRGCAIDHRFELGGRLLVALRVKQRAAQSL